MKERNLKSIPSRIFCPSCHKEMTLPIGKGMNFTGALKVLCKCNNGSVIINIEDKPKVGI